MFLFMEFNKCLHVSTKYNKTYDMNRHILDYASMFPIPKLVFNILTNPRYVQFFHNIHMLPKRKKKSPNIAILCNKLKSNI